MSAQIGLALFAVLLYLVTLVYVGALTIRHRRVAGILLAWFLWVLSFLLGWVAWLIQITSIYPIPIDFPGVCMFGVMIMLAPVIMLTAYWIIGIVDVDRWLS